MGKDTQIKELRAELARRRLRELATPFAEQLMHDMGVVLAATPFGEWPDWAKAIYTFSASVSGAAAVAAYNELLPPG